MLHFLDIRWTGETRGNRSRVNPFGGKTKGSRQILGRHALLGPRGKKSRLLNHPLRRLVEPVAMAIRAIHHAGGDNRVAALTNFEVAGGGDDLFGAGRTVGEMGVFGGHERNLSAPEDVEKGVDRFVHRFARRLGNRLQNRLHSIHGCLADC